jgi:hypothetical protein
MNRHLATFRLPMFVRVVEVLMPRRERPRRRRAAEKVDELAPLQDRLPKSLRTARCGSKHSTSGHGGPGSWTPAGSLSHPR